MKLNLGVQQLLVVQFLQLALITYIVQYKEEGFPYSAIKTYGEFDLNEKQKGAN